MLADIYHPTFIRLLVNIFCYPCIHTKLSYVPLRKKNSDDSSDSGDSDTADILVKERKAEVNKFQSEMEKEMEKRRERIEAWRPKERRMGLQMGLNQRKIKHKNLRCQ